MTSLAQAKTDLEARGDIVAGSVSEWFPPDGSDKARIAVGAALKRRIEFVKTLSNGNTIMTCMDRGVVGYNVDGNGNATFDGTETLIDKGAGPAEEAPDQKDAFRQQAETWAANNLTSALSTLGETLVDGVYSIRDVNEDVKYAVFRCLCQTQASPLTATFKDIFAYKDGSSVVIGYLV